MIFDWLMPGFSEGFVRRLIQLVMVGVLAGIGVQRALGQSESAGQTLTAATATGGTITGTVKAGNVPLPGVAVTATNTLTGKNMPRLRM